MVGRNNIEHPQIHVYQHEVTRFDMSTDTNELDKDINHDENPKPSQLKFLRPAHLMMFANVVCDPPLGHVTVMPPLQRSVCLFLPKLI